MKPRIGESKEEIHTDVIPVNAMISVLRYISQAVRAKLEKGERYISNRPCTIAEVTKRVTCQSLCAYRIVKHNVLTVSVSRVIRACDQGNR